MDDARLTEALDALDFEVEFDELDAQEDAELQRLVERVAAARLAGA